MNWILFLRKSIILLALLLLSGQARLFATPVIIITDTFYRSPYNGNAFLLRLKVKNISGKTILLKRNDYPWTRVTEQQPDSMADVSLLIKPCSRRSITLGPITDYFFGIFKEARNYYDSFLKENNRLSRGGKYKLRSGETIYVNMILAVFGRDMALLDKIKEACAESEFNLVLKSLYAEKHKAFYPYWIELGPLIRNAI